jgi:hypothetical protein
MRFVELAPTPPIQCMFGWRRDTDVKDAVVNRNFDVDEAGHNDNVHAEVDQSAMQRFLTPMHDR